MIWARVFLLCIFYNFLLNVNCEELIKDTNSRLLNLLTESEKLFLFGVHSHEADFEIAHLKHSKRRRRSLHYETHEDLKVFKDKLNLKLNPKSSFLDPQFLLVKRWHNKTEPVVGHDDDIDDCYYKSDNAAISLCDDVRGVVKLDKNYYFIHPLPERFHHKDSKTHIIIKRSTKDHESKIDKTDAPYCLEKNTQNITHPPVRIWTKHRRKRDIKPVTKHQDIENFKLDLNRNKTINSFLEKLSLSEESKRRRRAILPAVFVETAVFVDRDLYKHMTVNFPKDTERELVRFVLAMINAVQLLYHDPSLGRTVNFILKRLEILHEDPSNLKRPHDIDRFLSNFCTWQRLENPPGDNDPLHWDHALILTGLDLYVVSKNGKVSSQVVGLAPVAGMCTVTSSCTVNEGRHFESVYVVAHEIGHNLGMRHDGPLADNGCDPSAYIMSPTLGSGKITWSTCSKSYLQKFLDTVQSRCLLDHGNSAGQLDHSAEGILPGERFDADQQCMLKYGRGSRHSGAQSLEDICRDLHCQRERYTWTSHPALEGTKCGDDMWCRGGECLDRSRVGRRRGVGAWSRWSQWSDCASACLLDDSHDAASTGVSVANRRCTRSRHENTDNHCSGHDKKYQSCHAEQCQNVPHLTVREFADQICRRASDVDRDLVGTGLQRLDNDDVSSACAVWCHTRNGGFKSRGWTLPDGTSCSHNRPMFCISGICQKFSCDSHGETEFSLRPADCGWEALPLQSASTQHTQTKTSGTWRRAVGSQWQPASGCHYHCITPGSGVRLVTSPTQTSIQLCRDPRRQNLGCSQKKTPNQYATLICSKYKDRVRRLSGLGMQITPSIEDPDRPCRVACQDDTVSHRFYMVNGRDGWFPLGTSCSRNNSSYCVSGRCLEFGPDDTPASEMVFTLPLLTRNNVSISKRYSRQKRSLQRERMTVRATLMPEHLDAIISKLNLTGLNDNQEHITYLDEIPENIDVDFNNPIHIQPEENFFGKIPKYPHQWD